MTIGTRQKFYAIFAMIILLFTMSACGSTFSEKDLAACQSAWENTSDALSSAPRATYSASAPDPTFDEVTRHYEDLLDSRKELIALAASVESSELKAALMDFAIGTGAMAIDFLNNPRSRGTAGITKFNDSLKSVLDLCEASGWER